MRLPVRPYLPVKVHHSVGVRYHTRMCTLALARAGTLITASFLFAFSASYRVGTSCAFDGRQFLKVGYALFGPDEKKLISTGESIVREPAGSSDYETLVAAMSRALAAFSQEIVAVIPDR